MELHNAAETLLTVCLQKRQGTKKKNVRLLMHSNAKAITLEAIEEHQN